MQLRLTGVEAELTTAVTDAVLTVVVVAGIAWLCRAARRRHADGSGCGAFRSSRWLGPWVRSSTASTSTPATRELLWQPLYLTLGSALACFSAGAIGDWRGDAAARRSLPALLALVVAFYLLTRLSGGKFVVFVLFEALALFFALAVYARLAFQHKRAPASCSSDCC